MTDYQDPNAVRRALARVVRQRCPAWLDEEDIVQCAMLKVLHAMSRDEPPSLSSGYLFHVARSAVVDEIRRSARSRTVHVPNEVFDAASAPDPTAPPPEVLGNALDAAVAHCLREMNPSRRSAVALYLEGRRPTEIAAELGSNRKRADNLAYRGIQQLRARLTELGWGTRAA